MSDNFTPNMGTYTNLTPFRFWCQKVLPLTYDNSLSYYELLCKVVDYLNKTMEDVDTAIEDMEKLYDAYDELQEFVTDYFDNLDVQSEIDHKLDEMAENGQLLAVVSPYLNYIETTLNEAIEAQDAVLEDYSSNITTQNQKIATLENRMDTFSSLEEGSTTGDAELADIRNGSFGKVYSTAGDAVRDADNQLLSVIKSISDSGYQALSEGNHWAIGAYNTGMNATFNANTRARYIGTWFPKVPDHDFVALLMGETNYTARVAIYDRQNLNSLNTIIVGYTGAQYGGGMIVIPREYVGKYIGIELAYRGDLSHVFTDEEIATLPNVIKFFYADIKSDISMLDSEVSNIITRINEDERKLIFNYPIDKSIYMIEFADDNFITESEGNYQTNSNYPYLYGERAWIFADAKYPLAFSLNNSDYKYRAFLYSNNTSTAFIDKTAVIDGDDTFIVNGKYNDIEYRYVRFNIWDAGHDETSEVYESLCEAFEVRQTSPIYPRPAQYPNPEIRFTVEVPLAWRETSESNSIIIPDNSEINAILKLPVSYRQYGEPTPLIMYGHGASSVINDDTWYTGSSNFNNMINAFISAGYAVFDVSNTRNRAGGFPDWGCLPLMNAYIKAWDYIKDHYNVEDKLYILSSSMGTCAALNMMKYYPGSVIASIQTAPRPICKVRYDSLTGEDKTRMAQAFDMDNGSWDGTRLNAFNHVENIIEINGQNKLINAQYPPIKVLVGKDDSSFLTETRNFYSALANSGVYVDYREVAGASHDTMTFLSAGTLKEEAVAFFNKFKN